MLLLPDFAPPEEGRLLRFLFLRIGALPTGSGWRRRWLCVLCMSPGRTVLLFAPARAALGWLAALSRGNPSSTGTILMEQALDLATVARFRVHHINYCITPRRVRRSA